jgi:hypothetical protein
MDIYVFAILKCRELKKNKKTENTVGSLPCELAPRHTAKHVARRTATKTARQRHDARQRVLAHGNVSTHGNGVSARQRPHARQSGNAHGNDRRTRQRPLPCVCGTAHGKDCVAVRDTAVRSLPSVDARQSRCRAFCALCRAGLSHGKASISGSARRSRTDGTWLSRGHLLDPLADAACAKPLTFLRLRLQPPRCGDKGSVSVVKCRRKVGDGGAAGPVVVKAAAESSGRVDRRWRPRSGGRPHTAPDQFLAAAAIPIDSRPRPTDFRARMAPLYRPAVYRSPLHGRIHRHTIVLEHHHGRGGHIATTSPCLEHRQLPIQAVPSACPIEQERR